MKDITAVTALANHRLSLRFEDGSEGVVDAAAIIGEFKGVFEPLADQSYFERVRVNEELGTVEWPNGADLDPVVLYCKATNTPLPAWARPDEASSF